MKTCYADTIATLSSLKANSDYADEKSVDGRVSLRMFIASMLSYYPWWIKILYRLRQTVVRLLGLGKQVVPDDLFKVRPEEVSFTPGETTGFFIVHAAEDDRYWIAETPDDKHLKAYLGVIVEPVTSELKKFCVVTIVHYKHWTGPVYFNLIRSFHHLILARMLRAGIMGGHNRPARP